MILEDLPEQLFQDRWRIAAVVVASLFAWALAIHLFLSPYTAFWRSCSWVGLRHRLFPKTRAGLDAIRNTRGLVETGYKQFSKNNIPFVLPKFGNAHLVILPGSQARELIRKPDNEVDLHVMHYEQLASLYTSRKEVYTRPLHLGVVRRQLTRKLPLLADDLYEEVKASFDSQWDVSEGKPCNVLVYRSCIKIVSRAANKIFTGIELCHSAEFLENSWQYAMAVFTAAAHFNLIPRWVRPIIAPYLTRHIQKHLKACLRVARPVIERRIRKLQAARATKDESAKEEYHDGLQWVILESLEQGHLSDLDPEIVCRRILALNMVAVHTTSIAITNTLFDLYSSSDASDFVDGLRQECDQALSAHRGRWTKAAVDQLNKADSAIKESMRLSVRVVGMHRMVTAPNGVDFGDDFHVPFGVRVALPNHSIQRDPDNYPEADRYNAFRFSELRGASPVINDESVLTQGTAYLRQRQQGLVTPNDAFLAWGHGRHACPGRFFAAHLMKLMLAHVVTNYDVRPLKTPQPLMRNEFTISDPTAMFEIKPRAT